MKYHIVTFGCQQNWADSERVSALYESRGFEETEDKNNADVVAINTCVIRERAGEKVFGYIRNLKKTNPKCHIVLTGCLVGAASRESSGKMMKSLRKRLPDVELLPLEEVGFSFVPKRKPGRHAWLPISNGCNNFCTYCIVPFSRGKERSRSFQEVLEEASHIKEEGFTEITLLGQNVNSYGADLLLEKKKRGEEYVLDDGTSFKPVMVRHLGRHRIPTLFVHLLERIARMGFERISFLSSNPWDFSDELIDVISKYENIDREIHLPIQSGSDAILKAMNRWYTRDEYYTLIQKIRKNIPNISFTTDIIVGFPGETEKDFQDTMDLADRVGFVKAYIACFSPRPGTKAEQLKDDISYEEKKRRFHTLNTFINQKYIHYKS
jgi:tRNA-2-methylthio-N6-dimethylallyladenosine synthase